MIDPEHVRLAVSMLAASLVGPRRIEAIECADLTCRDPETVLVRSEISAICGTDLHTVFGATTPDVFPMRPGYPGHESIGAVLDSSSDALAAGQRVLLVPDGTCKAAFADLQVVPVRFAIPAPPVMSSQELVFGQQLGTVVFAMRRFWSLEEPPDVAAVAGAGPAGLMFVQVLRRLGCPTIVVSDPVLSRREAALSFGANIVVPPRGGGLVEAVMDVTGGRGAELVIEAAGHDASRADALRCVRINGRVGLFGLPERRGPSPVPLEVLFARRPTIEVSNVAQHEPNLSSFREALDLIAHGEIDVGPLLTDTYPIERIADAFAMAHEARDRCLKVAIEWPR